MASYGNFQSDNKKYTSKSSRVNTHNADFTPTVEINGRRESDSFYRNQKKWADLVAYFR